MCWSETGDSKVLSFLVSFFNFTCRKCDGNIGEAVEQKVKLCDEVKTILEFTSLGDRVRAYGGCGVPVTAGT